MEGFLQRARFGVEEGAVLGEALGEEPVREAACEVPDVIEQDDRPWSMRILRFGWVWEAIDRVGAWPPSVGQSAQRPIWERAKILVVM